ncbi:MAG: ABC transporter ATP-binding protein [Chloroflexota bacterium]|nr:ABC transporter ATP-binding protein [Chloroflexota bacterium]
MWGVATAMDLLIPQVIARVIDEGIRAGDRERLAALVGLTAALIFVRGAGFFFTRMTMRVYETRVASRMRLDFYAHLQRLPFSYYDRVDSGDIITRAVSDLNRARMFAGVGVTETVRILGLYVAIIVGMALTSATLTLMVVPVLVVLAGMSVWYGKLVRPMWQRIQQQNAALTRVLSENLNGVRVVKAFATEAAEVETFGRAANELFERSMRPAQLRARLMPAMLAVAGIGTVIVLGVGGRLALEGTVSVGVLVAFYYYFARLIPPTQQLGFVVQRIAIAMASGGRVFELLDEPVRIASPPNAHAPDRVTGHVELDSVNLAYGRREPVLHDVSANIPAGSVVGIVGPTGSGKSSLTQLIPRYYDATSGAVRLDGADVRQYDLTSLRRQVTIVPQDAMLFSDTVRNNLAYGDPTADTGRIVAAARDAQALDFIQDLPEGFETVVGERGVGLSGGQRQRVTIARALLTEAPVLILDDATASVDTQTERRIQEALRSRAQGRTTFVISQRVSSVQDADQILVIEDGRVTDRGTHDELEARPGFYRELVERQRRSDLPPAEAVGSTVGSS